MTISIDVSDVKQLGRDLERFTKRALPFGAMNACNKLAFDGRKVWQAGMRRSMTLRNRYTERSVQVVKAAPRTDISKIQATLGSTAPYMAAQEFGQQKQIGHKHAIPTSAAAGQQGAKPRTKLIRRPNRMSQIELGARPHTGSRKQRNAIAIRMAQKAGNKFVHLETDHGRGLFRISGKGPRAKITMMWDLSRPSLAVPKNPMLERTVTVMEGRAVAIFYDALLLQAKRNNLLGY